MIASASLHAERCVFAELLDAVATPVAGRGGDDLDHEIRRDADGTSARELLGGREEGGDVRLAAGARGDGELCFGAEDDALTGLGPGHQAVEQPDEDRFMRCIR